MDWLTEKNVDILISVYTGRTFVKRLKEHSLKSDDDETINQHYSHIRKGCQKSIVYVKEYEKKL